MITIFKLPWGGSVTLLSMLPIVVYSNRYGIKQGLVVAFVFSIFQLFQGIGDGLFAWGLTPTMLIACILLDYILAYTLIGLGAIYKKRIKNNSLSLSLGAFTVLCFRYLSHILSYFSN